MSEPARIPARVDGRVPLAASELLPLVYDELRRLASEQIAREPACLTLQATALVHEAYLKLVGDSDPPRWADCRHFYAAAAEAMRRILVDEARRRRAGKRGGGWAQVSLEGIPGPGASTDWLAVDDALARLAEEDPGASELVRLKVFAGLSVDEAAEVLGLSRATAYRDWSYARAWLRDRLSGEDPAPPPENPGGA